MFVIHMCRALLQISWLKKGYSKLWALYLLIFDILILTFVLQTLFFCALKSISLDEHVQSEVYLVLKETNLLTLQQAAPMKGED